MLDLTRANPFTGEAIHCRCPGERPRKVDRPHFPGAIQMPPRLPLDWAWYSVAASCMEGPTLKPPRRWLLWAMLLALSIYLGGFALDVWGALP